MAGNRIVMLYPAQGFSGTYVRHAPLSLLYASSEVIKAGYDVRVLDTRLHPADWRERLAAMLDPEVGIVGISVMSGRPISFARELGAFVKERRPDIKVVWGGPHATFYPETILEGEPNADFVVSGYGSQPFLELCNAVRDGRAPEGVPGVSWRDGATIRSTPSAASFEFLDYRDIPYHLIEDYGPYGQLDQDKRIFSLYSAVGCPYQCSFCSSPAQYAKIPGKKWISLKPADVVDHIQFVIEQYGANYIYFIDDDSFPNLANVEAIIDGIAARGLKVGLGFRGARINEIRKMTDEFLDKLAAAGTDILHIGAESGSDRILKLMRKNCTAEQIIEVNQKLARHPQITAAYNFVMGLPSETIEDVRKTRDLMLRLVDDNPNCLVFPPNKFRPLPGTELYDIARKEWGYEMPSTLESWANIEVEGDISSQWYGPEMRRFCNMMLICSYFIDNKIERMTRGTTPFLRFARLANRLYRPFARMRMRNGWDRCLIEYTAYNSFTTAMSRGKQQKSA